MCIRDSNYSFLDQSVESLSAKGDGGLRQLRSNVLLNQNDNIETPPDDYIPNKVENVAVENLQKEREASLTL